VKVIAEISPGVCGLPSRICADSPDGMLVTVEIESECPRVRAYAEQLTAGQGAVLDAFQELLRKPLAQTTPVLLAAEHGLHTACLLPVAVLKAAEAAAGLALPQGASIELKRAE